VETNTNGNGNPRKSGLSKICTKKTRNFGPYAEDENAVPILTQKALSTQQMLQ